MLSHVIWAREAPVKSLSAKTVLLVLASHADKENKAYPGIPLLARECSMTERGVIKAIQFLTNGEPPYLAVERQTGKHNLYRLMMAQPVKDEAPEQAETRERSSPLNDVHPGTTFTPPVNVVHPTREPGSPPPVNVVHPKEHIKESKGQGKDIDACAPAESDLPASPSLFSEPTPNNPAEKPAKKARHEYTPEFEALWELYPAGANGIKPNKVGSFRCYNARLKEGADYEILKTCLKNYRMDCDRRGRTGTEFVKHPTTFFGPNEVYLDYKELNISVLNPTTKPGGHNGHQSANDRPSQWKSSYQARLQRDAEALASRGVERDITDVGHRVG